MTGPQRRLGVVLQDVFTVVDRADCDWRDEYLLAIGLLENAFERVPESGREFLLEKLTQEDLPNMVGIRSAAFHRGVAPIVIRPN